MLGSRCFYAQIRGGYYSFGSKRHRDKAVELLGGVKVPAKQVYDAPAPPFLIHYTPVLYWKFAAWLADMLRRLPNENL